MFVYTEAPPRLEDYLAGAPVNHRRLLVELVRADLEHRLRAGLRARAA